MTSLLPLYPSASPFIVKSYDCYMYDSEGKEYIDFEAGVWCCNLGHCNRWITGVMESQIQESVHHGYKFRNRFAEELSGELQKLVGFTNGASVFLSSGSEAVNLSITLANHLTGLQKILKIDNSYLSAYGRGQVSPENTSIVNVPFNDIRAVSGINFSEISAFVLETGGASYGMVRFPGNEFVRTLVQAAREHNCLIIAEEVTTGMGRMGTWFGFQHYDIVPDMVVTGKALGNGYPASAVTVNQQVRTLFEDAPFRYAQSHQNDPLGCAIGLEVIKTIKDDNLLTACQQTGWYFKNQLEQLQSKHTNKISDVRARGLMLALEFSEKVDGEAINNHLFENGLVAGYKNNVLRFLPPLTIKASDIDKLIEVLDKKLSS